jgi:hypothetical protein
MLHKTDVFVPLFFVLGWILIAPVQADPVVEALKPFNDEMTRQSDEYEQRRRHQELMDQLDEQRLMLDEQRRMQDEQRQNQYEYEQRDRYNPYR